MEAIQLLKNYLTIDGERYYHYTQNGKYHCDKFVVIDGIHYYNAKRVVVDTE